MFLATTQSLIRDESRRCRHNEEGHFTVAPEGTAWFSWRQIKPLTAAPFLQQRIPAVVVAEALARAARPVVVWAIRPDEFFIDIGAQPANHRTMFSSELESPRAQVLSAVWQIADRREDNAGQHHHDAGKTQREAT